MKEIHLELKHTKDGRVKEIEYIVLTDGMNGFVRDGFDGTGYELKLIKVV